MIERSVVDSQEFYNELLNGSEASNKLLAPWKNARFQTQDHIYNNFLCAVRTSTNANCVGVIQLSYYKAGVGSLEIFTELGNNQFEEKILHIIRQQNSDLFPEGQDLYKIYEQFLGVKHLSKHGDFEVTTRSGPYDQSLRIWRRDDMSSHLNQDWRKDMRILAQPEISAEAFRRSLLNALPGYSLEPIDIRSLSK